MKRRAFIAALVVNALFSSACASEAVLHYEPAVVELEGRIETELDYGPPGFGRTPEEDERLTAIVLRLDRPIAIAADPQSGINTEAHRAVHRLQLTGRLNRDAAALDGRRVVVTGRLFTPTTGQWVTDVAMEVDALVPEPQP